MVILRTISGSVRPHSRKLWDASGGLRPHAEIADSLRLFALFVRSAPTLAGRLRLFAFFDEIAESLRLFALFVRSSPENCGTSQAFCIFCTRRMKIADSLRRFAAQPRKLRDVSERLGLFALF